MENTGSGSGTCSADRQQGEKVTITIDDDLLDKLKLLDDAAKPKMQDTQQNTKPRIQKIPPALSTFQEFYEPKEMENSQSSRQGNINDQVSNIVNALTLSLIKEFKHLHPLSKERCIYRVPKRLRVLNEKAYTPQCVSIGPYHHGKDELNAMEEHKTMYLLHFLDHCEVSLETFILCVKNNETRLRNSYQERIELSSEDFVRLMLVDAVFVIMVMLRSRDPQFCNEDDLLFSKPWMISDIRNDMMLLENQLPFFILDDFLVLSNLVVESFSMVKLSSNFLDCLYSSLLVVNTFEELNFSECKHLVDFLRMGQQPSYQNKYKHALDFMSLPSAVELHRAGVKFQLHSGSNLKLVDINFRDGILEIPLLIITSETEFVFRNLQAFEQCHLYTGETYLNDYIEMIGFLVTNEKDVEFLIKEGIVENWLRGNEQVVHLLHNLVKENTFYSKKFYFTDVVNDLNKYCRKRRNGWRASFIQNYFYSPWAIISIIAATLLLLLTIVQTICSILQVKQQQ